MRLLIKMVIEEITFRKKPILVIRNDDKRILFSAGTKKIKVIIENIEILKEFVEKHSQEKGINLSTGQAS